MTIRGIITVFSVLFLLSSFNNDSSRKKVIIINIKEELDNAKATRIVTVHGYTDSLMLYGVGNSPDTLSIKSRRGRFIILKGAGKITLGGDLKQELGGKWPGIGETVLMVKDTNDLAALFAFRTGDDYRFWDPNSIPFANSIFLIPNRKPFKQLPVCLQYLQPEKEYFSCSDGCLVEATAIKERD